MIVVNFVFVLEKTVAYRARCRTRARDKDQLVQNFQATTSHLDFSFIFPLKRNYDGGS